MGTPVPPDWPPLDSDKWYCVTVDSHVGGPGVFNCAGAVWMQCTCCVKGDILIDWIATDKQCSRTSLCVPCWPIAADTRIVSIAGPYDVIADCSSVCF